MSENKKLVPETQKKIDALCSLKEDDFSRKILLPLFQAMNYERVEFNGGVNERGRDLIAQKSNPPLPNPKTVYVQSKKIKSSHKAAGGQEFDKLVFQVRQCLNYPVTDVHGKQYHADEVYIICPNQINARFIDEIKHIFFNEGNKDIHLFDGVAVIDLIEKYKPELMDLVLDIDSKIVKRSGFSPGNSELLQAIKQNGTKSIEKLYNDLSFFVGSIDSNLLMHFDVKQPKKVIEFSPEVWPETKETIEYFFNIYEVSLNKVSLEEIEESYDKKMAEYNSDKNQCLITERKNLHNKVFDLNERLSEISSNLSSRVKKMSSSREISSEEEESVKFLIDNISEADLGAHKLLPKDLLEDLGLIKKIAFDIQRSELRLLEIRDEIKQLPRYLVEANYEEVKAFLDEKIEEYFSSIEVVNKGRISKIKLKKFLVETEHTLTLVDDLVSSRIVREIFEFSFARNKQDRVSISAHDIFETGHDVAVYGSAGVGKTTTLEMYSKLCEESDKDVVYVPLNRVVERLSQIKKKDYDDNKNGKTIFLKNLLIKAILVSRKIDPDVDTVEDAKRFFNRGPTIILDGLDEAFSAVQEIIPSIKNYKSEFPNSQIIISSRDCVSYLDEIDFFGITLLPFTKSQLIDFVNKWFEHDSAKGRVLVDRIAKDDSPEALKTPLLATIVCSLVEKGVSAPSTENEVYSERLRLLLGDYDFQKGISRQNNTAVRLLEIARILALAMHEKRVRSLPLELMKKYVFEKVKGRLSQHLVDSCLSDLIDPCCILILDPISNEYSFGHFRFQEHLVALAIKFDRGIGVAEITANDWWRGALCIYAQDGNITNLVAEVYNLHGNIKKSLITLREMALNVPASERDSMKDIIQMYAQQDDMEKIIFDDHVSGYDLEDFDDILH